MMHEIFTQLCRNPDFIEVYNDCTGDNVKQLTIGQLFSTGSMFHLIEVTTKSGDVVRLTDSFFDVDYQGQTFLASGDCLNVSGNNESSEINNNGINVKISNVRPEYVTMIRAKQFDKAEVKITMAFLNPNTGSVSTTFPVFSGVVDNVNISIDFSNETATNESEVQVNSIWEVLTKNARSHASDGIHRSYAGNENDLFFSRVGKWNSEALWRT